jgi:hypothetical protein
MVGALMVIVAAIAAGIAARKGRTRRAENGHDRAALREENWYGHLMRR